MNFISPMVKETESIPTYQNKPFQSRFNLYLIISSFSVVQLAVDAALAADRHDEGATAAAVAAVAAAQANEISDATIAVGNESEIDADVKKNEQRRKRYREKSVEEDYLQPEKKLKKKWETRDEELASRRLKDRERYAGMTPDQREEYNKKRR